MSQWLTEQMRRDGADVHYVAMLAMVPDFDLDAQLIDTLSADSGTPQWFRSRVPVHWRVVEARRQADQELAARMAAQREEQRIARQQRAYERHEEARRRQRQRAEDVTAQQWGYRSMEELQNDARLFCYGIGSHYFDDVYRLLREELKSQPEFALALDMLVNRLRLMRDKLEAALPTATGAPVIPGESIEVKEPENVVQD